MIVECPTCGIKNRVADAVGAGRTYRCGSCKVIIGVTPQGCGGDKIKKPVDEPAVARLIAAGALFFALFPWPYGYYAILRWAVCIIAAYSAFRTFDTNHRTWAWIFVGLAVLFNPIAPIHLARMTWNVLDALAATILVVSVVGMSSGRRRADPPAVTPTAASPPSNGVAAVLSLFIPGAGQIYKRQIRAGLLWLASPWEDTAH
jgi:hypothetical protein